MTKSNMPTAKTEYATHDEVAIIGVAESTTTEDAINAIVSANEIFISRCNWRRN